MSRRLDLSDYDPDPDDPPAHCRWCSRGWHHECRGCNCRHDHDDHEEQDR